jgi:hypothetical protein
VVIIEWFRYTRLLEMREADPQAILPQLPEDIPTVMVDIETKVFCETSDASPMQAHILYNANTLFKISEAWCCQYKPLPNKCTKLTGWITAGTDICATENTCTKCYNAATANQLIASYCVKGLKAGGYVRYIQPFYPNNQAPQRKLTSRVGDTSTTSGSLTPLTSTLTTRDRDRVVKRGVTAYGYMGKRDHLICGA